MVANNAPTMMAITITKIHVSHVQWNTRPRITNSTTGASQAPASSHGSFLSSATVNL